MISNYFKIKTKCIREIPLNNFTTKTKGIPEILSNYFKNKPKGVPGILSNYFKNKIRGVLEIRQIRYFKHKTLWIGADSAPPEMGNFPEVSGAMVHQSDDARIQILYIFK
ncbi:hypothetical protein Zmor_003077 [Zophobas morio]|uniref:Uncharacterized protein n=1 Tax=Zophobas morio TaxID=2755281 RepID=A0AA38HLM3_9CUCU|nr:hypothetical protein Zmor_003077 [Zophobas morio]